MLTKSGGEIFFRNITWICQKNCSVEAEAEGSRMDRKIISNTAVAELYSLRTSMVLKFGFPVPQC
jgi:hypothetical protein